MATDSQEPERVRPHIDPVQLASGALAAITAAVLGSRLGVSGTVIGAAFGSVVGSIASASYAHYLARTATRVRTVIVSAPIGRTDQAASDEAPTAVLDPPGHLRPGDAPSSLPDVVLPAAQTAVGSEGAPSADGTAAPLDRASSRWPTWRPVVAVVVATFVLALAVLTGFELLSGRPISSLTGGGTGDGTTLQRVLDPPPAASPSPTDSPTPTPSQPTAEPSPTATSAEPTGTATPTTTTPTTPTTTGPTTPPSTTSTPTVPPP